LLGCLHMVPLKPRYLTCLRKTFISTSLLLDVKPEYSAPVSGDSGAQRSTDLLAHRQKDRRG
jgi:hypothetical protein